MTTNFFASRMKNGAGFAAPFPIQTLTSYFGPGFVTGGAIGGTVPAHFVPPSAAEFAVWLVVSCEPIWLFMSGVFAAFEPVFSRPPPLASQPLLSCAVALEPLPFCRGTCPPADDPELAANAAPLHSKAAAKAAVAYFMSFSPDVVVGMRRVNAAQP
jgi:hypothetical protein